MRFSDRERKEKEREGRVFRGYKEIRSVYVPILHHDEIKADLMARVKKLEGVKND